MLRFSLFLRDLSWVHLFLHFFFFSSVRDGRDERVDARKKKIIEFPRSAPLIFSQKKNYTYCRKSVEGKVPRPRMQTQQKKGTTYEYTTSIWQFGM